MKKPVRSISEEAVKAKTGKGWAQWFAVLDRFDVSARGHKSAAEYLHQRCGVSGWWAQMITVEYERQKGLRVLNQSCRGDFQVSVSRALGVPVSTVWSAFTDEALLRQWCGREAKLDFREGGKFSGLGGGQGEVRRVVRGQRVRLWWNGKGFEGRSAVEIRFESKGEGRSSIVIQHSELRDKGEVEKSRKRWTEAVERLQNMLR